MKKDEQYIENLLNDYGINSSTDDLLLHGFFEPEDVSIEEKFQSIFENGVKKRNSSLSILSTASLCNKNEPIGKQVANYVPRGKFRVVIHIPESLEKVFLGNCLEKHGDAGNQYGKNCLLDFLELDSIPTEFIVGIYYTEKTTYNEDEEVKYSFEENPNYFNHKTNKENNTKKLLEKIKSSLKKASTMKFAKNAMDLDQNFDSKNWIDILNKFFKNEDYGEFATQRDLYDLKKIFTSTF